MIALAVGIASGAPAFAQQKLPTFKEAYYSRMPEGDAFPDDRSGFTDGSGASIGPGGDTKYKNDAFAAFEALRGAVPVNQSRWLSLGPVTATVLGPATYTGQQYVTSGRITALAISGKCTAAFCPLFVAAAGGGVWRTMFGLSPTPEWTQTSEGLPTNFIGSIIFDPTDKTGQTLYAGTGEANGSSDSEAGLGLYRSTDLGASWKIVPGSYEATKNRSIGAIAIDPADGNHILIGTSVGRHGASGTTNGRMTPPGAATLGLYESRNGGKTFSLIFSRPQDLLNPATPDGADYFRGSVNKILPYRSADRTQFYFAVGSYGLFRTAGGGGFEQVFVSAADNTALASKLSKTDFALAPMGRKLRIYLANAEKNALSDVYRVDDANVPASNLAGNGDNSGWLKLSSSISGSKGFGSYNFCGAQCWYDIFIASPAGKPDTVWIGGNMQYDDIFRTPTLSNGRTVMRSTDAGVLFTDMTNDNSDPLTPNGMHPDQHAIAFAPANPDIAFLGSDGGLVRTDGTYVDTSAYCGSNPGGSAIPSPYRGLSGTELINCKNWLSATPSRTINLNKGLVDLQFQGVSFDPQNPRGSLIAGTQDNGTWIFNGSKWVQSVGGDGGQAGIGKNGVRLHTYYLARGDISFGGDGSDPFKWNFWTLPDEVSSSGFYSPVIADQRVAGTWFVGSLHVWRTIDDMGGQAYLEKHCNEFYGDFAAPCGDLVSLGGPSGAGTAGDLTGQAYGADKSGGNVSMLAQGDPNAPGATPKSPLWAATSRGRVFLSMNANAASPSDVAFVRLDTPAQPNRFVSGIAVNPKNPLVAYVTFTSYDAYTPNTPGHVFRVTYNPSSGLADWENVSGNLNDQPILSVAFDAITDVVYVGTDYGVAARYRDNPLWRPAADGIPFTSVFTMAIDSRSRTLYAATHGRGIYRLGLGR